MIHNEALGGIPLNTIPLNVHKKVYASSTLSIVLFAVFLVTSTVISSVFISFYWYSKINDSFRGDQLFF